MQTMSFARFVNRVSESTMSYFRGWLFVVSEGKNIAFQDVAGGPSAATIHCTGHEGECPENAVVNQFMEHIPGIPVQFPIGCRTFDDYDDYADRGHDPWLSYVLNATIAFTDIVPLSANGKALFGHDGAIIDPEMKVTRAQNKSLAYETPFALTFEQFSAISEFRPFKDVRLDDGVLSYETEDALIVQIRVQDASIVDNWFEHQATTPMAKRICPGSSSDPLWKLIYDARTVGLFDPVPVAERRNNGQPVKNPNKWIGVHASLKQGWDIDMLMVNTDADTYYYS